MKAIVHDRYGSPEVLRLAEVAKPVAGDNEVLVRVHAATINARDWHAMRGDPYLARMAFGLRGPKVRIRGTDFAGRVAAVGRQVTRFRPGDEVYGEVEAAFAEYVSVPEDLVGPKPANLSFEQAAAIPLAANTALMGLRDVAHTGPGQRVLINGASGGVGTFAVQLAKSFGAHVTGVCSTRNIELVRSLGADEIVDYTREDFAAGGRRYDVVFDLVGNRSLADLRRALTRTGTLILSGGGVSSGGSLVGPIGLVVKGQLLSRFVRQRVITLSATPSRENLDTLRELAESGALTPIIDRTLPLSETAEAIRYVEQEHARAKVVLNVA
ncbi:NAD(P)-dependent alcohol dehydrogenase [Actinoplanes sp. ATCC 53533]|uniref:NAD(P)-dependent alcohol dehydrogenase n=1 Tax=Actinoplanes sp. ATCC 53533 TaxID=1288362 RepID=UPI000F798254|nr:NAD(P)-dependent alcohol dehydrogenase [Actinoplanes sp. ATCC 53533]RSM74844.1 NAD(P)-dependent alcohol dehydrogenase [Actinoplanes sp. ATCC 53533]